MIINDFHIPDEVAVRYHSEDLRQIIDIIDIAGGQTCDIIKILTRLTENNFIIQRYVKQ